MTYQPQLIGRDTQRTTGKENVRKYNIMAASMIKDLIEKCFGPNGKEKIYIDIIGEATLTKDGATFLRKIDVEHPAAKVLIDAANTVDNEVGDGTISVVIIASSLLEKAEELMIKNFSPTTIIKGYEIGLKYSLQELNKISKSVSNKDITIISNIVEACIKTKILSFNNSFSETNKIAKLITDAIKKIYDNDICNLEIDNIKIEEKQGNISDSQIINGILIDKSIDSDSMPRSIDNAKVLLIDDDLEFKTTKIDAEIFIADPNHMFQYKRKENMIIKNKIENIISSGSNVVVSRKGINLEAQEYLSKAGIISIKRVKENDLLWLEKATGAKITKELESNSIKENLGYAGKVYEKTVCDDKMIFIDNCKSPKAVTLLLRANTKMMLDECHRAVVSALTLVKAFISNPSIVIGAGSCEAIIANKLRKRSLEFSGREQIVLTKFAEALEEIPLTIAKNCGMNLIDTSIQLNSKFTKNTNKIDNTNNNDNLKWFGIDINNKIISELKWEILEPSIVKEQVLNTAVEVSCLLLNIDDVLVKKPLMNTHTHEDGTEHSHEGGNMKHDHYFDRLGKQQRPNHHYY
jgi:chaperonin GroEL (HSP60 family)